MSQTKPAPVEVQAVDVNDSFLAFRKLDDRAVLPVRGSVMAAGLDICSIEDVELQPKSRGLARTGIHGVWISLRPPRQPLRGGVSHRQGVSQDGAFELSRRLFHD